MKKPVVVLCGLLSAVFCPGLRAATWDGGLSHGNFTVNSLWTTANNWADAVPIPSAVTDVIFAPSGIWTSSTQNISNPFVLRSVTFAASANVTALSGSALSLANNGFIAQNSTTDVAVNLSIGLNTAAILTGSGTGRLTVNGIIKDSGTLRLIGTSGGTGLRITLNGVNGFTGPLLVGEVAAGFAPVDVTFGDDHAAGAGGIQFYNGNTIRAGGAPRTYAGALGTFLNSNGLPGVFTFGSGENLDFSGPVAVQNAAKTLRVDNTNTTFSGNLSGGAALTKTGAGTLSLSGSNSAFSGAWIINEGVVKLGSVNAMPPVAVTLNVDNGLNCGSLTAVSLGSLAGAGNLNLGSTALAVGSNNSSTIYSGTVSTTPNSTGSLRKSGTGTLELTGTGSAMGKLTAENGSLLLNGGSLTATNGLDVGTTLASPSLTLSNGTVLTCGNSSSFIVSGGSNTVVILDGAGTTLHAGFQTVVAAGFGPGASSGTLSLKNKALLDGGFVIMGAGDQNGIGAMTVASGANVTCQGGVVGFVNGGVGTALITGPGSQWQNEVSLGLGGFSAGQLGGRGSLTVSNSASVTVAGATTFWAAGSSIDLNGGTLNTGSLTTYTNLTAASIAVSDPSDAISALALGTDGSSSTYAGAIINGATGPGSLTKVGSGTVTLTGPLSYTGFTRVWGGRLLVTQSDPFAGATEISDTATLEIGGTWGNNPFSRMQIAAGGTLTGNGTIRGSVTNFGLIEVAGPNGLAFTGLVVNQGIIRFKSGAAFAPTGPLVNHGIIDVISAGSVAFPPGFVNEGTILDRTSIRATLAKVGNSISVGLSPAYAAHRYTVERSVSLDSNTFGGFISSSVLNSTQPLYFIFSDDVPQRFYRIRID